jgi:uncharacterized protein involved in exopolysaccharide biosynthesis
MEENSYQQFSPKKFIVQSGSLIRYLIKKWWIILIGGLALGATAAFYYSFKKAFYTAEITFAIDEDVTGNASGAVVDAADQMGLGSSFDAGTIFSSVTNIVELMQSRLLIEKTLKRQVPVEDKTVRLADFFLDSLGYRDKWLKNSPLYKYNFFSRKLNKQEQLLQNNTVKNMYLTLVNKYLQVSRKGKGTTIISVSLVTEHELFSKYFLETLLDEVTRYYIETKTERSKINLSLIQKRTDSIKTAYNQALYGRAAFTDAHLNPVRQTSSVSVERKETDVQILRASYVELVRSLENAKTTLMRETPLIQYLDLPILPLKIDKPNLRNKFILFFVVGAFLSTCWLVAGRLYHFILSREE